MVRRKAKRQGISEKEAREQLLGLKKRFSQGPIYQYEKYKNEAKFKLFIRREKATSPQRERFGSYGLSLNSSVPEF